MSAVYRNGRYEMRIRGLEIRVALLEVKLVKMTSAMGDLLVAVEQGALSQRLVLEYLSTMGTRLPGESPSEQRERLSDDAPEPQMVSVH
jgi:hypothetical protein